MSIHFSGSVAEGSGPNKVRFVIFAVVVLAMAYGVLQSLVPLGSAVKIGADEDFELSKATLCLNGYHLYTEIWDDQPPLDTVLITGILQHFSRSVLGPRLLTVSFGILLLCCLFWLVYRLYGFGPAWVSLAFLIGSPGFLELSSSCMQEIPALMPVVASVLILSRTRHDSSYLTEVAAGAVFAVALQIKLIGLGYTPLLVLLIVLNRRQAEKPFHRLGASIIILFFSSLMVFVVLNWLTGNSLIIQLRQAWEAHFATPRSYNYGGPAEHRFDWAILLRNWDMTVPALFGVFLLLRASALRLENLLPAVWLILTFLVFSLHTPWWAYYYIHNVIPLSMCAGIGVTELWRSALRRKRLPLSAAMAAFCLILIGWIGTRVFLEEKALQSSPRLMNCLVLKEIQRFKPYTTFMFTDRPIYSFHVGLPMPPRLAVISLKRFWAGEITAQNIINEVSNVKPGLILLAADGNQLLFQDILAQEYRLVYRDGENLLYAHQSISRKPGVRTIESPP